MSIKMDLIRSLWSKGLSLKEIGSLMGMTRNAVSGVCWRAGLRRGISRTKKMEVKDKEIVAKTPTIEVVVDAPPVEIEDLKDHHCRWIVGKGRLGLATYCGKKKFIGSYCMEHYKRAHHVSSWRG